MKMGKYISGVGVLIAFVMMPHFLGAGTPFRVEGFNPESVRFDVTNVAVRAKSGDAKAYYELGVMFLCGHQVPYNRFVAYDYFRKASDLGCGYASLLLGLASQFGGGYINKGLSRCGELPYRGLIAAKGEYVIDGLGRDDFTAREYFVRAVSNGLACAAAWVADIDRQVAERDRERREREDAQRRILSGDCRTEEERQVYRKHVEQQEEQRRRNEEFKAEFERRHAQEKRERIAALEAEIEKLKAGQMKRLLAAESGEDADELYWGACFLRAWAATADSTGANRNRRVELARRSWSCLRKAADKGHGEAKFRLGLMLWGGDAGVLGPDPVNRGGFLEKGNMAMQEWIPEQIEYVKKCDVKGPAFAPFVKVRKNRMFWFGEKVGRVLIYGQDVEKGMALIRNAAADGFRPAITWLHDRDANGLPDTMMPWMIARDRIERFKGKDILEFNFIVRSDANNETVFRHEAIDRKTGQIVWHSEEVPERLASSPWE